MLKSSVTVVDPGSDQSSAGGDLDGFLCPWSITDWELVQMTGVDWVLICPQYQQDNMECCLIPCCALIRFTVMWLICQSKASWMNFLWLIWFVCCLHMETSLTSPVRVCCHNPKWPCSYWSLRPSGIRPRSLHRWLNQSCWHICLTLLMYLADVGVSKLFAFERFIRWSK